MASLSALYPAGFVADASFLVDLIKQDSFAVRFTSNLKNAKTNSVNIGETFSIVARQSGVGSGLLETTFSALGLQIEPFTTTMAHCFVALRDIDDKQRQVQIKKGLAGRDVKTLALGDLACLSQAIVLGLPVLTGDRHWESLSVHGLTVPVLNFRDRLLTP